MFVTVVGRFHPHLRPFTGITQITGEEEHLGHDFACSQVAAQATKSGRAEGAAHGAASLTADAECTPPVIQHQDSLDRLPIRHLKQNFQCVPGLGNTLRNRLQGRERCRRSQPVAQGLRQIRHLVKGACVFLVDPLLNLTDAIGGDLRSLSIGALFASRQRVDDIGKLLRRAVQ